MSRDIVIAGVGGQGTVLASRIIAYAAIQENKSVRTAETIGMAQRGGSVLGYVRISDTSDMSAPLSPLIDTAQADVLLAFEPAEAARNLHLLKPGGCLISAKKEIMPVHAQLAKEVGQVYDVNRVLLWLDEQSTANRPGGYQVILVDGAAVLEELSFSRGLNVVLLGVAMALNTLSVGEDSFMIALKALVPARYLELNLQAYEMGKAIGADHERPTMEPDLNTAV
jgi:indolepyruvate ferredoxin oxidoreductase beta subunit